jgi:hypothetical protein
LGETHQQRSHIRRLSLILNVTESESICSDFSPEKLVICVGGAALGAKWRWVAPNKPMSGLLLIKNFLNFKISRWRFVQMPIKLFLWWWWFKLQYFLPHLSLSRLFFYLFEPRNVYNEIYSSNLEIKSIAEISNLEIFYSN